MRYSEISIAGINAAEHIYDLIRLRYPRAYYSVGPVCTIIIAERYNFPNSSMYTMTIIITKALADQVETVNLEIVGSGSGTGWLNIDYGRTRKEIKKLYWLLYDLSKSHNYVISELQVQRFEIYDQS